MSVVPEYCFVTVTQTGDALVIRMAERHHPPLRLLDLSLTFLSPQNDLENCCVDLSVSCYWSPSCLQLVPHAQTGTY